MWNSCWFPTCLCYLHKSFFHSFKNNCNAISLSLLLPLQICCFQALHRSRMSILTARGCEIGISVLRLIWFPSRESHAKSLITSGLPELSFKVKVSKFRTWCKKSGPSGIGPTCLISVVKMGCLRSHCFVVIHSLLICANDRNWYT